MEVLEKIIKWLESYTKKRVEYLSGKVKKMISAITSILGSLGGLATSYIDGKSGCAKAEAQIRMKEATGEIDWELVYIATKAVGRTNG